VYRNSKSSGSSALRFIFLLLKVMFYFLFYHIGT
jgi:hypothetical protein